MGVGWSQPAADSPNTKRRARSFLTSAVNALCCREASVLKQQHHPGADGRQQTVSSYIPPSIQEPLRRLPSAARTQAVSPEECPPEGAPPQAFVLPPVRQEGPVELCSILLSLPTQSATSKAQRQEVARPSTELAAGSELEACAWVDTVIDDMMADVYSAMEGTNAKAEDAVTRLSEVAGDMKVEEGAFAFSNSQPGQQMLDSDDVLDALMAHGSHLEASAFVQPLYRDSVRDAMHDGEAAMQQVAAKVWSSTDGIQELLEVNKPYPDVEAEQEEAASSHQLFLDIKKDLQNPSIVGPQVDLMVDELIMEALCEINDVITPEADADLSDKLAVQSPDNNGSCSHPEVHLAVDAQKTHLQLALEAQDPNGVGPQVDLVVNELMMEVLCETKDVIVVEAEEDLSDKLAVQPTDNNSNNGTCSHPGDQMAVDAQKTRLELALAETICTAPEGAQLPERHASMQAPALSSSSRPMKRTFSAMELLFQENKTTKEDEQLGLALHIFAQLELDNTNTLERQVSSASDNSLEGWKPQQDYFDDLPLTVLTDTPAASLHADAKPSQLELQDLFKDDDSMPESPIDSTQNGVPELQAHTSTVSDLDLDSFTRGLDDCMSGRHGYQGLHSSLHRPGGPTRQAPSRAAVAPAAQQGSQALSDLSPSIAAPPSSGLQNWVSTAVFDDPLVPFADDSEHESALAESLADPAGNGRLRDHCPSITSAEYSGNSASAAASEGVSESLPASAAVSEIDSKAAFADVYAMSETSFAVKPQRSGVSCSVLTASALHAAAGDMGGLQPVNLAHNIRRFGSRNDSFGNMSLASTMPSFTDKFGVTSRQTSFDSVSLASRRPSFSDRLSISRGSSATGSALISSIHSTTATALSSKQPVRSQHSRMSDSADKDRKRNLTAWQLGKDGLVAVPLHEIDASPTAVAATGSQTRGSAYASDSSLIPAVQSDTAAVNRQSSNAAAPAGKFGAKLWQAASSASSRVAEDFAAAKQAVQDQRIGEESIQHKMADMVKTVSDRARPALDDVASKSVAMGSSIAARANAVLDRVGGFDEVDAQLAALPVEAMSVKDAMAHALGVKPDAMQTATAAAARTLSSWRSWGRQAT